MKLLPDVANHLLRVQLLVDIAKNPRIPLFPKSPCNKDHQRVKPPPHRNTGWKETGARSHSAPRRQQNHRGDARIPKLLTRTPRRSDETKTRPRKDPPPRRWSRSALPPRHRLHDAHSAPLSALPRRHRLHRAGPAPLSLYATGTTTLVPLRSPSTPPPPPAAAAADESLGPRFVAFEHKRDANGFAVRPQHVQQYRMYSGIYKEEEEKGSKEWNNFLQRLADSSEGETDAVFVEGNAKDGSSSEVVFEKAAQGQQAVASWTPIRASLGNIQQMMGLRVEKDHLSAARLHVKESSHPLKEELEPLVHDGVPMALRGEIWQAFVGARVSRVEGYYGSLLAVDGETEVLSAFCSEKWSNIEKDLPRTFPGHPSLDEDGRNALRRLLEAYARHDPEVGYCQAMNVFAGLLLLLMPEENAFWTLVGIIDCFNGYFSEEMIESEVDQLVLKELVQDKFPKLANHLDYLGLEVLWFSEPWFLSIFTNVLPWETALRVWDVLLFDGNGVMLFQTVLALLEIYGTGIRLIGHSIQNENDSNTWTESRLMFVLTAFPSLMDTKHACDAVMLLRSLASSTFDSKQLVLTACQGYTSASDIGLQELRNKQKDRILAEKMSAANKDTNQESESQIYSLPDKEEIRSAFIRADELKLATMEVLKQDNWRQLSAKVQQWDKVLFELRHALSGKQKEEQELFRELMYVEKALKIAEKPCIFVDQEAFMQRYGVIALQERDTFEEKDEESSQQKALIPLPFPSSNLHRGDMSVVVKISEQLIVLCDSGTDSLSSAELRGVMNVHFPANIDPFVGIEISNQLSGMVMKHHPSASQDAFADDSMIRSEYHSPFRVGELKILRWCKISGFSPLPLEVEASRHPYHRGCRVEVNYRAPGAINLKDILISMPIPITKTSLDIDICKDKGRCTIEENNLVWRIPPIDVSNTSGSLVIKYTFRGWTEQYHYFPINVTYSFMESFGLKVDRVLRCNEGHSLQYTHEFTGTAGYTLRGSRPTGPIKIRSERSVLPWNIEEIWSEDDIEWEDG